MWKDPIVEEIHALRAQTLARFGGDVHRYDAHILAIQAEQQVAAGSGEPTPEHQPPPLAKVAFEGTAKPAGR